MRVGLVTDPLFLRHDTGPGHPERPDRLRAVLAAAASLPLVPLPPRDATRRELEGAHDPAYIASIEGRIAKGATHLDADTAVCHDSFDAAVRAAGAALALGEAWLGGRIDAGFAAVRPPGHHACRARAMGFCLFNNVAVLARSLQAAGKRVAILDWDVHHGNGTQEILWEDPAILFASLHQHPLYPGTGFEWETGAGNIVNVPLPAGSGGEEYMEALRTRVLPRFDAHAPDVLLVSCGFDAHERDPLARMRLTSSAYGDFTRLFARWPILSLLEGGYDLQALSESTLSHLSALLQPRPSRGSGPT